MRLKHILLEYTSPVVYMQEHLFQYLSITSHTFLFLEQLFNFYCMGDTVYINKTARRKFLPN